MTAIDTAQIDAMIAQIRSSVSNIQPPQPSVSLGGAQSNQSVDFATVFKNQMDQINNMQQTSQQLGQRFLMGDNSINLSDVMISSQKADIALQTASQVRSKLLTSYQTIMNMQV